MSDKLNIGIVDTLVGKSESLERLLIKWNGQSDYGPSLQGSYVYTCQTTKGLMIGSGFTFIVQSENQTFNQRICTWLFQ